MELVPEEERDRLQELDSLTGQPRPTDFLLYALPVSVCSQFLLIRVSVAGHLQT